MCGNSRCRSHNIDCAAPRESSSGFENGEGISSDEEVRMSKFRPEWSHREASLFYLRLRADPAEGRYDGGLGVW
jgi:hypothetical protein